MSRARLGGNSAARENRWRLPAPCGTKSGVITAPDASAATPALPRIATGLAVAVVVSLAAVVAHGWWDHARREQLETAVATTAVGDMEWAPLPDLSTAEQTPVVSLRGLKLYSMSAEPHDRKDIKMHFAGMDDAGKYRVYESVEDWRPRKKELNLAGKPTYFLKHAPGMYLRVQPR